MPFPSRIAATLFSFVLVAACGNQHREVVVHPKATRARVADVSFDPMRGVVPAAIWTATEAWNRQVLWDQTLRWNLTASAVPSVRVAGRRTPIARPGRPAGGGSLDAVMACIRDHESGNYAESSHTGSGSGAYQFIPGTWRAWSIRAGYSKTIIVEGRPQVVAIYDTAYQAPPTVQDAVTAYTLQNGGAGNWSNRWGDDPCTAGMPGGG